jgi:hypothetical protein
MSAIAMDPRLSTLDVGSVMVRAWSPDNVGRPAGVVSTVDVVGAIAAR